MSQGQYPIARATDGDNDPNRTTSASKFGTTGVLLKAKPGRLYRLDVINAAATAYFLMVFDKATAPTAGNAPIWRRRLPASGEVTLSLADFGLGCKNGIAVAISTTEDTLTLAAADDAHYAAQWK